MILKRCSAFPAFFSCPSSVSSGRALRGTNAQSDTLNLFVGIGAEITQMSHSFPPFSFLFFLLLGIVSLEESSRIPPRCKPGTTSHSSASAEEKNKRHERAPTIITTYWRRGFRAAESLCLLWAKKNQGEDQACVNVTRSEADRHHS